MKSLIFIFLILRFISIINLKAQDYLITFAGSGLSSNVSNVKIENITQMTTLTMNGSDVLHLQSIITGMETVKLNHKIQINLFPNPSTEYSILRFDLPETGITILRIYDIFGRKISETQTLLEEGQHTYRMEGFDEGIYYISIVSNKSSGYGKLVSTNSLKSELKILFQNSLLKKDLEVSSVSKEMENSIKGISTESLMQYNYGDKLIFTANSGNYTTIITDIPSSSKTITFDFVDCTDGDNIIYPVVDIGAQTWMAKNLNTSKYNDGTAIPLITVDAQWADLTTDAYCEYENSSSYSLVYGKLYNWYVVDNSSGTKLSSNGGKNVCPIGWHVPSSIEWTTLTTYLGGESSAGSKLRETGTTHWVSPNNTFATNDTGFTALPGGNRHTDGVFINLRFVGFWWSSTERGVRDAYMRCTQSIDNALNLFSSGKDNGLSVRCLRD